MKKLASCGCVSVVGVFIGMVVLAVLSTPKVTVREIDPAPVPIQSNTSKVEARTLDLPKHAAGPTLGKFATYRVFAERGKYTEEDFRQLAILVLKSHNVNAAYLNFYDSEVPIRATSDEGDESAEEHSHRICEVAVTPIWKSPLDPPIVRFSLTKPLPGEPSRTDVLKK